MLQDFQSVSDHFGTLYIKGWKDQNQTSNIKDRVFLRKQLTAFSCYLFSQKALSKMFDSDLNTPIHSSLEKKKLNLDYFVLMFGRWGKWYFLEM